MCRGCGYCQTHGNLGKAAVVIAELKEVADNQLLARLCGTLRDCLLDLGNCGVPLKYASVFAVDYFCVLI